MDKPDSLRKIHAIPIPVGGGVMLFCVTILMLFGTAFCYYDLLASVLPVSKILNSLFISSALLVCVGLIDDKYGMSGKVKLFFQILAATILLVFAKDYSTIILFGNEIELGHLFYPVAVFWLVGMINSVNLLDGADGVASTAGLLMSLAAGVIAIINGQMLIALIAVIFAGAIFGFLICNLPPARVYLGDTGSMLIGFVIGVLLLRASTVGNRVIYVFPALAVVVIPMMDSVFAILRRKNSRRKIFSPDRGHIHHRLQMRFKNGYKVLACLAALMIPGCIVAILGMQYRNDWIPLLGMMLVLAVAASTGLFGREELQIITSRIVNRFKKRLNKKQYEQTGEVFYFQGKGTWNALWFDIVSVLKSHYCVKARLDINIPFLHEDYFSEWENLELRDCMDACFKYTVPFLHHGNKIGTLELSFDVRKITRMEILHVARKLELLCENQIREYIQFAKGQAAFQPDNSKRIHAPILILRTNVPSEEMSASHITK